MTDQIRVVCMDCKNVIRDGPTGPGCQTSHGLCGKCLMCRAITEIHAQADEHPVSVRTFELIAQICADTLEEL